MGQRNQLLWDLPAMETFLVNQAIYGVPGRQFRETLDELMALLDLGPLSLLGWRRHFLRWRQHSGVSPCVITPVPVPEVR